MNCHVKASLDREGKLREHEFWWMNEEEGEEKQGIRAWKERSLCEDFQKRLSGKSSEEQGADWIVGLRDRLMKVDG